MKQYEVVIKATIHLPVEAESEGKARAYAEQYIREQYGTLGSKAVLELREVA